MGGQCRAPPLLAQTGSAAQAGRVPEPPQRHSLYTAFTGAARRRSGELLSERAGEVGKSLLKFLNERLELRLRLGPSHRRQKLL